MRLMVVPRKLAAFRLDSDLVEGLQRVWERDGVQPSEQVRRAIRAWLEKKGAMRGRSEQPRARPRKRS
jgi:metal-responsive CopG/Arc/MetJ family transcriptional regulator